MWRDSMNSMICPYCGKLIAYNSYFDVFYCSKCGGFFKQATVMKCNDLNKPLTNAQKIRAMSGEELAEFIKHIKVRAAFCKAVKDNDAFEALCSAEWLQMPAEEDNYEQ